MYEWDKKTTRKSVHITLLALLLIQVFVFIILYYSDMFMILFSGKYNVEEDTQGKGWSQGRGGRGGGLGQMENRNLVIYTHTPIIHIIWLYSVYELACAYSTQAFVFCFFLKRFANSNPFGGPAPEPLSDPWLRSIFCSSSSFLWVNVTLKKGRASGFQHYTGR